MFLLFSKIFTLAMTGTLSAVFSTPVKWFLIFGKEVKNVGPRSKLQGTDSVIPLY